MTSILPPTSETGQNRLISQTDPTHNPIVAIGGVGGSGTRLVASLLMRSGYHLGNLLNKQNDNLYFTLIFKRPEILTLEPDVFDQYLRIFLSSYSGYCSLDNTAALIEQAKIAHPLPWSEPVATSLSSCLNNRTGTIPPLYGWKEPNTHVIVDRLYPLIPRLKYIHVIRNGLDMAFSGNQRQALLWGEWLVGFAMEHPTPSYLLKYWCAVHKRILQWAHTDAFFLLNFDRLAQTPHLVLHELFDFIQLPVTDKHIDELSGLIIPSESIGRFKAHDVSVFDQVDIDYVAELGFPVH